MKNVTFLYRQFNHTHTRLTKTNHQSTRQFKTSCLLFTIEFYFKKNYYGDLEYLMALELEMRCKKIWQAELTFIPNC